MSLFDEQGRYIPWGAVERVRTEGFVAKATLPDFLSVYNSANETNKWSLGSALTTEQYLQVDTSTVSGQFSVLNINDNTGVNTSSGGNYQNNLMEIRIGLEGLYFSHDNTLMEFGINILNGNNRGARVGCTAEGTFFEARPGQTASRKFIDYDILQGLEYGRRRNLEFVTRPDRWVLLFENGYCVAKHQFSAAEMGLGQVQPKPVVFNRGEGTARWLRCAQIKLTLCHD